MPSILIAMALLATPDFPGAIQQQLGLAAPPACTTCHATNAGGIGTDLRALKDASHTGAISGGVDADGAQRFSEGSSEGAGDDPSEQQDDQSAEDRWDRGNESRESGGEAGQ